MAKKTTKKETVEQKESVDTNEIINEINKVVNTTINNTIENTSEKVVCSKPNLKNISITDLVSLENACRYICSKYESGARLYFSTGDKSYKDNNELFNEFMTYHDTIFNELKERILYFCKK